jgi:flagellar protein FlaF
MDSAGSGRQIEISILEMASGKIRNCLGEEELIEYGSGIDDALRFNQKVWDVFCADWSAETCALEDSLRESLLSLGLFVKKRTFTMLAQPTRSGVLSLVELNDNLIQGLRGQVEAEEDPTATDGSVD